MTVQQAPKHSLGRIIARALSGRCWDGIRRTDATFLHHATRDITVHERAPRYAWLPGWRRALLRIVTLACACLAAYAYVCHRAVLIQCSITVLSIALAVEIYRIRKLAIMWSHRRKIIYPLWHILAEITGYAMPNPGRFQSMPGILAGGPNYAKRDRPEKFLTIPRDYDKDEKAIVKFELPYTWEANTREQARVSQLISRQLGGDWAATWSLKTSPRFVALCHEPRPPQSVSLAEFVKYVDSIPDSSLALGIGASGQLVAINLDSDAPHVALSMGTGGGKSDTVALIIAMLVRRDCERIDVIDPKRVSHNWARGLPRVFIHRYVAGQMEAIHNARIRMDSRYDALETDGDMTFRRQVLVIEEQNSLMQDLKDYWTEYRASLEPAERAKCTRENPAIADLRYILNKGRQCKINVISIYQRMSAEATGGGDARENYGAKILCRCSIQTWKILVGTRMPKMSRTPGRATLVIGDDMQEVQRAHASITKPDGSADKEGIARLREFALNGAPDNGQAAATVKNITISEPELELMTLREACETGTLKMRYPAAKKARQRDSEFPAGIPTESGALGYLPAELRAWQDNRLRAKVSA